jgi:hypothetical protein
MLAEFEAYALFANCQARPFCHGRRHGAAAESHVLTSAVDAFHAVAKCGFRDYFGHRNRMNFRDVPNLMKFEKHARAHSENEIVMDCYKRIRDLIGPVPKPPDIMDGGTPVADLRASCEAVEKSIRILWACAAATDQIAPRLWNYLPDYNSSLDYFLALNDLELMAITKPHRILWEEAAEV